MPNDVPDHGYVLENSPIDFVLVGPGGRHRAVLLKSRDAGLDLIGAEQDSSGITDGYSLNNAPLFPSNWGMSIHVVRGGIGSVLVDPPRDSRSSFYSFTWRGAANYEDERRIAKLFDRRAADIYIALRSGDTSNIEWQIAPVVLECHKTTIRRRNRRVTIFLLSGMTLIIWIAVVLVLFGHWMLSRA